MRTRNPKPAESETPPIFISYKATPEFHGWLTRLAERLDLPLSQTLDRACAALAEREGFDPPPRRWLRKRRSHA